MSSLTNPTPLSVATTTTSSSSSSSYRRISSNPSDNQYNNNNNHHDNSAHQTNTNNQHQYPTNLTTRTRRPLSERVSEKCIAGIWVVTGLFIGYGTNFWNVVVRPERTNANIILIQLGSIGLGMNTIFILYLIQYLPNYSKHKIQVDYNVWNVYCPKMIPIITVVGVVTFLLYVRGTYPVWGFLSPFILCIVSIGILNILHFIPSSFVPSIL